MKARTFSDAEGAPGAAQDDDVDRLVLVRAQDGGLERGGELAVDGVQPLGPVEGDEGERIAGGILDRIPWHGGLLL
jgi:hypothetical protein